MRAVQTFEPLWNQQYNSIPVLKKEKAALAETKSTEKREINWAAIRKLVENPWMPEPIRKYWTGGLEKLEKQTQP